jgi:hypothetical protein
MNYEDLSQEMQGVVRYVAENLDLADAAIDLNEAMYQRCRLADINPWLAGRIEELAEECLNDNELPTDLWEQTFEDEEDLLGMAIDWNALYGKKRYRITSWCANGEEKVSEMNDPDCVITAIAAAEKNAEILSYMLERDGLEIINTSNRVKHE